MLVITRPLRERQRFDTICNIALYKVGLGKFKREYIIFFIPRCFLVVFMQLLCSYSIAIPLLFGCYSSVIMLECRN